MSLGFNHRIIFKFKLSRKNNLTKKGKDKIMTTHKKNLYEDINDFEALVKTFSQDLKMLTDLAIFLEVSNNSLLQLQNFLDNSFLRLRTISSTTDNHLMVNVLAINIEKYSDDKITSVAVVEQLQNNIRRDFASKLKTILNQ